jgi:selenocysteine-specific elongation factor
LPQPISFILATAGHVDHGKSALVTALTGTDPDRLPEEKARGITIDLGFTHFDLEDGAQKWRIGVVDVPGHEDFVRNMVAGVGSVDVALLVVAADDGPMPQTEEHLQILGYLGVKRGVVALTKADLVASTDEAIKRVRTFLRGTVLADAPIVPTSIPRGRGLEELRAAMRDILRSAPPPVDLGKPRLSVDRAFTLKGVGTVVTGTLTCGTLRRGQGVMIQPAGIAVRIRSLQTFGRDVDLASPGSRVALNLPDVQVRTTGAARTGLLVGRGDVVTLAELGPATETLDVAITRCARAPDLSTGNETDERDLHDNARVHVHHGSAAVAARVCMLNRASVPAGGAALAQLRLESPIMALSGDRLILRDWPQQHTLAGAMVLDSAAHRSGFRTEARRTLLEALAADPGSAEVLILSKVSRDGFAPRASLGMDSVIPANDIARAIRSLAAAGRVVELDTHVVAHAFWQGLIDRFTAAIDAHHREHPEQIGLSLESLRKVVPLNARADLFDALVLHLEGRGVVRTGAFLRRRVFAPRLPPSLASAGDKIRRLLADRPFDPPSRNQLAADDTARQALKFLLLNGEAVELSRELIVSADALCKAGELIRAHIQSRGPATVSDLKATLGSSRRVMVPLLERLDRDRVTCREGDLRTLPTSRSQDA